MSNKVVAKGPMKPNQGKGGNEAAGDTAKAKEQNNVKEAGKSGGQPDGHAGVKTELMSVRTQSHGDQGQQQANTRNDQHHGIHGGGGPTRPFQQRRDRRNQQQNRDFNRERHGGRDFRERDQNNQNTLAAYEHMGMNEPMPLPDIPKEPKKFTMRCRLFVGNITQDITEEEFREMFETYGEVSEAFINPSKSFGFIRLDFRHNAEAAKAALDGTVRKGRTLRIRFAAHAGAIKVKNLSECVSNELLHLAFIQFGEIEKAIVIVDDRGKSTGEGVVEFARKQSAQIAFKRINDGAFLLTASPRPVWVEPLDQKDDEDGLSEKFMNRNSEMYRKEREKEPRFAQPGSFEYEFAGRWKKLAELEKTQQEQTRRVMEDAQVQVEGEMESALMEYQEERLRQDLIRQQEELRRLQEMRQQTDIRRRQDMEIRIRAQEESERQRREEEQRMHERMRMNEEEIRQRQMGAQMGGPNSLMMGGGMAARGRPDGLMMQPGMREMPGGGMRDGVMRDMPPGAMRDMPPGAMRDMPPGAMRDMPPGAMRDMPPGAMRDMPPGAMRDMPPGAMRDMPPGAMRDMPPGAMRDMPPGAMRDMPPGNMRDMPPGGLREMQQGGGMRELPPGASGAQESQGGNRPLPPPPAPPAGMGVERGQGRRTPDGFPPGVTPAGAPGVEPKKENQIQARHGFDGPPGPGGNFGGGPGNFPNQGGNMFQRPQIGEAGMRGGNNPPESSPGRANMANERGNAEPERRRGAAEDFGDMKRMRRF